MVEDRLLLGRITAAYGIKGWVRIYAYTVPVEQIFAYAPWVLTRGKEEEAGTPLEGRPHGKGVVARLQGCETRDEAEVLIGSEIWVAKSRLPEIGEGEYYWYQLEGLRVQNLQGENLGIVDHLMESGSSDIMVVRSENPVESVSDPAGFPRDKQVKDRLVPFVLDKVVRKVDLESGTVLVDWALDWE